jgi:hypothetical protein
MAPSGLIANEKRDSTSCSTSDKPGRIYVPDRLLVRSLVLSWPPGVGARLGIRGAFSGSTAPTKSALGYLRAP